MGSNDIRMAVVETIMALQHPNGRRMQHSIMTHTPAPDALSLHQREQDQRWAKQQHINNCTAIMHCANLMYSATVSHKCTQLQAQITAGREVLTSLSQRVVTHDTHLQSIDAHVVDIQDRVSNHHEWMLQLKRSYVAQQASLQSVRSQLRHHHGRLLQLQRGQYKMDLLVDVSILLMSCTVHKRSISKLLVFYMTLLIEPLRRRLPYLSRKNIRQSLETLLFFLSAYVLRNIAMQYGLHQAKGSYATYIKDVANWVWFGKRKNSNDKTTLPHS